ncbi:MAG TPA: ABC transporter permease subunit [Candidatus Sumerlaeota bacterium]|nr:ABC transporter permease subunit [Candidatus Sumerlaeota bacterium]
MNWTFFTLSPVARKRLHRFREMKRAWWAFCLLMGAFVLSQGAEFFCSDRPLYLRMGGEVYFPAFRFYFKERFHLGREYTEDDLLKDGNQTLPRYKALVRSEEFGRDPDNRVVFPIIPYGPDEILEPQSLEIPNEVRVVFFPAPLTGTVNLLSDGKIESSVGAGGFLGLKEEEMPGFAFETGYPVEGDLKQALAARFANQEAPRFEKEVVSLKPIPSESRAVETVRRVVVSLPPYTPRTRAPKSVRLTLREVSNSSGTTEWVVFDERCEPIHVKSGLWSSASEEERGKIVGWVQARFSGEVENQTVDLAGKRLGVRFEKTEVRWPFEPVRGHPLGIDNSGRDVLARIIYAFRIALSFGLLLVFFSLTAGVVAGGVMGYWGGWVDLTGQRLIEIWVAVPFLYVMMLLGNVLGRSFGLLLVVYGLFNWVGISYYVRAEFLRLRKLPFVEAARCLGVPTWKILFKHILPNALTPVVTYFPFALVGAIGSLTALDYLGFGMPPPTASWGDLLNQAQTHRWAWWLTVYPALALSGVMILGVFIGEGVRAAFDSRDHTGI